MGWLDLLASLIAGKPRVIAEAYVPALDFDAAFHVSKDWDEWHREAESDARKMKAMG